MPPKKKLNVKPAFSEGRKEMIVKILLGVALTLFLIAFLALPSILMTRGIQIAVTQPVTDNTSVQSLGNPSLLIANAIKRSELYKEVWQGPPTPNSPDGLNVPARLEVKEVKTGKVLSCVVTQAGPEGWRRAVVNCKPGQPPIVTVPLEKTASTDNPE